MGKLTVTRETLREIVLEFMSMQGHVKTQVCDGFTCKALDTKIPPQKPAHGSCCTCQTCGRDYDDCVCEHNDTLDELDKFLEECFTWED